MNALILGVKTNKNYLQICKQNVVQSCFVDARHCPVVLGCLCSPGAVAVSSKLVQQLKFSMAEMSVLVILLPLVVVAAAGVSAF